MNYLVTGGAGFIGSHIVDALINEGHKVSIIDNLSTGSLSNVNSRAKFYQLDLKNCEELIANDDFDAVIHCAAQTDVRASMKDPIEDMNQNIRNSLLLFEAMRKFGPKKIIFLSTGGALYEDYQSQYPIKETGNVFPVSPYGISKLTIENYLKYYKSKHGFNVCVLRLANVYGERNEKGVINIFKERLREKKQIEIYGGTQTRDFIYVFDVVSAVLLGLTISGTYNVGTGYETSLLELASLMDVPPKQVTYKAPITGEVHRSALDSDLLRSKGWNDMIGLQNGLLCFD